MAKIVGKMVKIQKGMEKDSRNCLTKVRHEWLELLKVVGNG